MAEFKTPDPKRSSRGDRNSTSNTPKIVIPPSPLMKKLGYGTGVNVYLMERFSPCHGNYKSPWAVKKINRIIKDEDGEFKKRLYTEAGLLKSLNHPNIIGYRSYTHNDGVPCLVMESGDHSLDSLIEKRDEEGLGPFPPFCILKVAKDIASGLKYLHEEKKLLHGDLKSGNVLIKGDFKIAKLCDFGVSLKLDDKGVLLNPDQCYIGTECWSAPEALEGLTITHKTDMFSYGLVLWEMIALHPPHMDRMNTTEEVDDDEELSESLMEEKYYKFLGTRPCLPDTSLTEDYLPVLEIFYACTEAEPTKRPKAGQVVSILDFMDNKDGKKEGMDNKDGKKEGMDNKNGKKEGAGGDGKLLEVLHEDL